MNQSVHHHGAPKHTFFDWKSAQKLIQRVLEGISAYYSTYSGTVLTEVGKLKRCFMDENRKKKKWTTPDWWEQGLIPYGTMPVMFGTHSGTVWLSMRTKRVPQFQVYPKLYNTTLKVLYGSTALLFLAGFNMFSLLVVRGLEQKNAPSLAFSIEYMRRKGNKGDDTWLLSCRPQRQIAPVHRIMQTPHNSFSVTTATLQHREHELSTGMLLHNIRVWVVDASTAKVWLSNFDGEGGRRHWVIELATD